MNIKIVKRKPNGKVIKESKLVSQLRRMYNFIFNSAVKDKMKITIFNTRSSNCKLPYSWANLKEKIINFKIEQNEKDTVYRKSNYCYVETT